ncbi:hypothetical protein PTKIN_Ptkin06aG0161300 [Pterospermum kingtungense]
MLVQIAESDFLLAVREIKEKDASLSELFGLLKDISMFVDQCNVIAFQHVCRGTNHLAHSVAKHCPLDGEVSEWGTSLPPNFCIAEVS